MAMAARRCEPSDRPLVGPITAMMNDTMKKDAILSWFRGEFAAANAIIDALCGHLAQVNGGGREGSEYKEVFAAIHSRRTNWIPVLQMQKYHSIAEVAVALRKVSEKKKAATVVKEVCDGEITKEEEEVKEICEEIEECSYKKVFLDDQIVDEKVEPEKSVLENNDNCNGTGDEIEVGDDSANCEVTDSGSQEMQPSLVEVDICTNHGDCEARFGQIKLTKGFSAKEPIKGHMVNVVKGLKIYEDLFTDSELSKLSYFVDELRAAGRNGELSGETFILFNQQMKGNRRELIHFGVPIFGQINEETESDGQTRNIEPIPSLLRSVIDHLVQWKLIPEYKKPNGCIINFFEEGEYSQPFQKPPHLEQPISTLFLSESTMAFGRTLVSDNEGNYKGSLMLSLRKGSVVVLRGNSADMPRHVMCPSRNKRVSISFVRIKPWSNQGQSATITTPSTMSPWQPGMPSPYAMPNGSVYGYEMPMPKWGLLCPPLLMLPPMRAPPSSMVLSPKKFGHGAGGTGVFFPWSMGPRKPARHLPPRAQKGRFLALPLPPSLEKTHVDESMSEPSKSGV